MDDRTLIERAAKAAGLDIQWHRNDVFGHEYAVLGHVTKVWSPLTDDADIARLEADCEIDVSWRSDHVHCCAIDKNGRAIEAREDFARRNGDKQKARRYASTRAAASLAMGE